MIATILTSVLIASAALPQNDGEFAKTPLRALEYVTPAAPRRVPKTAPTDCGALEQKLAQSVAAKAECPLATLLADATFMREALALDAIRTAGAKNLDALEERGDVYRAFLPVFLGDTELMRAYAGAGLVPKDTATGIRVLADIWSRVTPSEFARHRDLAVAIASVWGAGSLVASEKEKESLPVGSGERNDPVWRFFFFRKAEAEGRLHPDFGKLKPWELRFVVSVYWDDESLAYALQRVNIPYDRYGSACWLPRYSGVSLLGQSVQGPLYYVTAPSWMGGAHMTRLLGGVCGGLSTFGSTACAAHGIPTYTVGQPGHCAFAFRLERGKWQGGFGGPDGGPHNYIFPGEAPTAVTQMEACFADDAKVARMATLFALARVGVRAAWQPLLAGWGLNYHVREAQIADMRARGAKPAEFLALSEAMRKDFKGHGFAYAIATDLMRKELDQALDTPEKRVRWQVARDRLIADTPPSWAQKAPFERMLDSDVKGLSPEDEKQFLKEMFPLFAAGRNTNAYGTLIDWSVRHYVTAGREDVFAAAFSAVAAHVAKPKTEDERNEQRKLYREAIWAAEKARSAAAVRLLCETALKAGLSQEPPEGQGEPLPKMAGYRLVSDRGMFVMSSTSGWDHTVDHINVLREGPGHFHTGIDSAEPWVLVDLGEAQDVDAIVIKKTVSCQDRMRHMVVEKSTDGATFFTIAETQEMPFIWKVELPRTERARWFRVRRLGDNKEVMHLTNVLLYKREGGAK